MVGLYFERMAYRFFSCGIADLQSNKTKQTRLYNVTRGQREYFQLVELCQNRFSFPSKRGNDLKEKHLLPIWSKCLPS